jgi:hypothetical protein
VKRRRLFIVIFSCILAVILGAVLWPRQRGPEPEYNGISLSTWLERAPGNDAEFTKAIKHMGTNALPVLVRSVDYQISGWKLRLRFKIAPKLPAVVVGSRPVRWLLDDQALRRADSAVHAFGILGSRATPALNDLRRIAGKHGTSFASDAIFNITSGILGDFNESSANLN